MPVQLRVVDAKEQLVAGTKYYLTIVIHTTDCPEGSPSAEYESTCLATHTQNCVVHVLARLESDGGGHLIVDPQPSCTAKGRLLGKNVINLHCVRSNSFALKVANLQNFFKENLGKPLKKYRTARRDQRV